MSLTDNKIQVLHSSSSQLSDVFKVSQEINFLGKYLKMEQVQRCVNAGKQNSQRIDELIDIITTTHNNRLYTALISRLDTISRTASSIAASMVQSCENRDNIKGLMLSESSSFIPTGNSAPEMGQISSQLNEMQRSILELHKKLEIFNTKDMRKSVEGFTPGIFKSVSIEKNEAARNYKSPHTGLQVIFCDDLGEYPFVDWARMKGNYDWKKNWKNLLEHKKKDSWLVFPPMLLPADLGGMIIGLRIEWTDRLVLRGGIVDCTPNEKLPQSVSLCIDLELSFDKFLGRSSVVVKEQVQITKSFELLCVIADQIDPNSNVPKAQFRVQPIRNSSS